MFELDEMLLAVLALNSTVVLAPAVEEGDNAEFELTLDTADAVPALAEASAEFDDATDVRAPAEDGVSSALPEDADEPAPAPEDEPAVFDVGVEVELPAGTDWM